MRKPLAALAAVLLVFTLAACGGGSSKAKASDSSTDKAGQSDTTSSSSKTSGGGGSFCTELAVLIAKFANVTDPNFDQTIAALQTLKDKAPSDLKDDMQIVIDGVKLSADFSKSIKGFGSDSFDSSAFESANSAFSDQFDSDAFSSAETNLETFAKSQCGIDLNSDSNSS